MRFWFVFDNKVNSSFAGQLGVAGLLGIEMIKTGLAGQDLAAFGDFQSLAI